MAKFATTASGAKCWPILQLIQVAPPGEQIYIIVLKEKKCCCEEVIQRSWNSKRSDKVKELKFEKRNEDIQISEFHLVKIVQKAKIVKEVKIVKKVKRNDVK